MNLIEVEPDKTKATEVVQRNEEPIAYRVLGAFNPTKSVVADSSDAGIHHRQKNDADPKDQQT